MREKARKFLVRKLLENHPYSRRKAQKSQTM